MSTNQSNQSNQTEYFYYTLYKKLPDGSLGCFSAELKDRKLLEHPEEVFCERHTSEFDKIGTYMRSNHSFGLECTFCRAKE